MKIGVSYDLKESVVARENDVSDALEEYDSVETVQTIKESLQSHGNEVLMMGGGKEFLSAVMTTRLDIVFNIAEGRGNFRSRESQVPAILEMMNVPYTGSDPQTLAVCLDKPLTKKLVSLEGVPTPGWDLIRDKEDLENIDWCRYTFPVIVKPAFEGSSKGIHNCALVHSADAAHDEIVSQLSGYKQPVMIEEFIDGKEVTVGIIGNIRPEVLGIMEVLPRFNPEHFVYSLEVKRDWRELVDYRCPAELCPETTRSLEELSLEAFKVLGCRDFSRVDFRIDSEGRPYFIEINPLPGLGNYSDLIIMGELLGKPQKEVIYSVFRAAWERYPHLV